MWNETDLWHFFLNEFLILFFAVACVFIVVGALKTREQRQKVREEAERRRKNAELQDEEYRALHASLLRHAESLFQEKK